MQRLKCEQQENCSFLELCAISKPFLEKIEMLTGKHFSTTFDRSPFRLVELMHLDAQRSLYSFLKFPGISS